MVTPGHHVAIGSNKIKERRLSVIIYISFLLSNITALFTGLRVPYSYFTFTGQLGSDRMTMIYICMYLLYLCSCINPYSI